MCHDHIRKTFMNNKGFGLIAAIFAISILAMVGLLIARHTMTGSVSSGEDQVWAQALYSAESVAQIRILCYDNGGPWGGVCGGVAPTIENFSITIGTDTNPPPNNPGILQVQASRGNISRQIQVKFIL